MHALLLLVLLSLVDLFPGNTSFRQEQQVFPRVRAAYANRWPGLQMALRRQHINPAQLQVYLRVFKIGKRVEVWAHNRGPEPFRLFCQYTLAGTSGTLGPKRRAGDGQVPEGCYRINRFNPNSLYHLSLGLDYPNAADLALHEPAPGGDIFIHGSNVTVGCLPITNACIEELYILAVEARAAGQQEIPVHIFPFALNSTDLDARWASPHYEFWKRLAPVFTYFEQYHRLPPAQIDSAGSYRLR
ncbi:murein L,D-transpeptidase family protein [Hymenobacter sp. BT730]|uniref:L,D-transpeptidase family protein n=1 Tax=Hymenobacter sp. BT730 TaxID=3063332 RepID=UPI0026DF3C5A|nr:L,D-transpeptidase family protein [Hymenobacter sp. BT730]